MKLTVATRGSALALWQTNWVIERLREHHGAGLEVEILTLRTQGDRQQDVRSEEHTSELQSLAYLVCRLLLEKKKPMPIVDEAVDGLIVSGPLPVTAVPSAMSARLSVIAAAAESFPMVVVVVSVPAPLASLSA